MNWAQFQHTVGLFEDRFHVHCVGPNQVALGLAHVPWWAFGRRALRKRLKAVLSVNKPVTLEIIFQERFFE